ncbi:jg1070, partial [Pararge aegeria aegeria]
NVAYNKSPINPNKSVLEQIKRIEEKITKSKSKKIKKEHREITANALAKIESLLRDIKKILNGDEAKSQRIESFKGYVPISDDIEIPEFIPQEPSRKMFKDGFNLIPYYG